MTACDRGFTLLELLVATAIVLLLAGALLLVTVPSQGSFRLQPAAIDVQQRLRVAEDAVRSALLSAGSGPGNPLFGQPLGGTVACLLPYRVGLRRPDPPGACRGDTLTVVSAIPGMAAPRIAAAFQGTAGVVTVETVPGCPVGDPACGLNARMSVLLVDASGQRDPYGVAAVVDAQVTLETRGPASARRFAAGAWIVPVSISTYFLRAASGPDGPQLVQYDGNQSELPLVDHVVALSFDYFGEAVPPQLRAPPGGHDQLMTYGPAPPGVGQDDDRDSWGAGENCVVKLDAGRQVPRLAVLGDPETLVRLGAGVLSDGPWCPDAASPARFDADLLRVRRVRVTIRVEAWQEGLRGTDPRWFLRPGRSSRPETVPDQAITLDVVPRALGGGR